MAKTLGLLAPLLLAVPMALAACAPGSKTGESAEELRGITKSEALTEIQTVADSIRAFYGPLEYKKEKFNFDLDRELAAAKAEIEAGQNEADFIRPFYKLLAKLKDGHVSLSYRLRGDQTAETFIPFIVAPVEGSWLVAGAAPTAGVGRGDKLVSIDGMTPAQMVALLQPLTEIGTPESTAHQVGVQMTFRPFYAPKELAPRGPNASVVMEKADGTSYTVEIPWTVEKGGTAGQITPPVTETPTTMGATFKGVPIDSTYSGRAAYVLQRTRDLGPPMASVLQQGATVPFFMTAAVRQELGVVEVSPKPESLTAVGVTVPPGDEAQPDASRFVSLRAYKYKYASKTVLLVRIPGFIPALENFDENVGWLTALLKENSTPAATPPADLASTPADVVVVDVTHNPGGAVPYVQGLASLFIKSPIANQTQANNADRPFINRMIAWANQSDADSQPIWLDRLAKAEGALDGNKPLTPFMPMIGSYLGPTVPLTSVSVAGADKLEPHPIVHWNKPLLVLHDELSGSGGDAFPMLLQNAGYKTFGAKTMGMGGSVELMATLPFSGGELRLTRGLFAPAPGNGAPKLVENIGIVPNYPYAHTIADTRAGFVNYAKAFSKVATELRSY